MAIVKSVSVHIGSCIKIPKMFMDGWFIEKEAPPKSSPDGHLR